MAKGTTKLTVLEVSISSVYTAVAYVEGISGPSLNCDQIEVTDLTDTWKTFLNGIPDGGEVTLDLFFDQGNATHKYLHNAVGAAAAEACRLKWNGSATDQWAFNANVQRFTPSGRKNDSKRGSITVKITGAPTLPS